MVRREDERPWDPMLDGVAPVLGVFIALFTLLAVSDCLG